MQKATNSSKAGTKIKLQGAVQRYKSFHSKHTSSAAVWDFLKGLEYVDAEHQYHATTWLELYLIYRIRNNPKPILDNPSKARSRATVRMQLKEFWLEGLWIGAFLIVDRGISLSLSKSPMKGS